jgi:hypothetical protein
MRTFSLIAFYVLLSVLSVFLFEHYTRKDYYMALETYACIKYGVIVDGYATCDQWAWVKMPTNVPEPMQ